MLIDGQLYWLGATWVTYNAEYDVFMGGNWFVDRSETEYADSEGTQMKHSPNHHSNFERYTVYMVFAGFEGKGKRYSGSDSFKWARRDAAKCYLAWSERDSRFERAVVINHEKGSPVFEVASEDKARQHSLSGIR